MKEENVEAQSKQARERDTVNITRATKVTEEVAKQVVEMFNYHEWNSDQKADGARVREALANAVLAIIDNVPPCPTRIVAIRKIVEARMDCNNAITSGGRY